jgi:branched-chain amino acid transport system ATP-binding protein
MSENLLTTNHLIAHYGDFQALFGINFEIQESEKIAIIGANGSGKSTFLKSIAGLIKNNHQSIKYNAKPIGESSPDFITKLGISLVPEGRQLFQSLSVEENLMMGSLSMRNGYWNLKRIYELFPILKEKKNQNSTELSGGQQQMVAIGRALMSNPSILLCDELSLGLAPIVIKDIYKILPRICDEGVTVVIVEQDIKQAINFSDRVYCFQEGNISLQGDSEKLTQAEIKQAYFGIEEGV